MGAQSSINQVIGAFTGAAIAAGKISENLGLKKEQGLLAEEQFHEAKADLTKLEGEQIEAGKAVEETSTAYEAAMTKKPGGKGNTKAAIAEKQSKALTEKEAAQRAFNELADRIEARKAMMKRAENIMRRTNILGGIR